MFMLSFRLSRKRVIVGALAVAAVAVVGTVGVRGLTAGEQMASAMPVSENAETETVKAQKVKAKTNEDRVAFLSGYGWTVEQDPVEVLEVIVPEEFDQVYQEYNALQQAQGFDLTDYAGKRCKRYTYRVTNYPEKDSEVHASILMYGDRLIGGDISSTAADGFMHGFAAPQ